MSAHLERERVEHGEEPRLQPYVPEAATLCARACSPMCPRLQPYVPEAATLCARGCNPMCPRLQPYVLEAATLCISGEELQRVRSSCTDQLRSTGAELATAQAELEAARRGVAAQLEVGDLGRSREIQGDIGRYTSGAAWRRSSRRLTRTPTPAPTLIPTLTPDLTLTLPLALALARALTLTLPLPLPLTLTRSRRRGLRRRRSCAPPSTRWRSSRLPATRRRSQP